MKYLSIIAFGVSILFSGTGMAKEKEAEKKADRKIASGEQILGEKIRYQHLNVYRIEVDGKTCVVTAVMGSGSGTGAGTSVTCF